MNDSASPQRKTKATDRFSKLSNECRVWEQRQRDGFVPVPPRTPGLWWTMMIDSFFRRR